MRLLCKYHCRECGSHFTSLAAFDAHRPSGACEFPDDDEKGPVLIERQGACEIADPEHPRNAVTVYEHRTAQVARDYFGSREALPGKS